MARSPRGLTSSSTTRAGGSPRSDLTASPTSTATPRSARNAAIAATMPALPPSTTGQPTPWARLVRNSAMPPVTGVVRGRMAWAPAPASSARGPVPSNLRASDSVERHPEATSRAPVRAPAGTVRCEERTAAASPSVSPASGPSSRRYARLSSRPKDAAVSSTPRCAATTRSSPRGCANGTAGWRRRAPCVSSPKRRKKGDAAAIGCAAEQTSWRNPGSVSSSVRQPPPILWAASSTRTDSPAAARTTAAARPLGPAPTTSASVRSELTGPAHPDACAHQRPPCRSRWIATP